ncbi:hypothetical protein FGADI_7619 [Fusarium gaditjirri]|uniref:Uncharacterized protein n=1 Tax=Fusarium gaditjirri TaxID=282569 RepID=A0A8H4WVD4_9HYPO|nr:hypothetical protein FGADI_7619 [Fusarium gaditjirri]
MGRYLDRWKSKTKELQIHILERLGPHGPQGWRKNKKAVWLTSLFSTEDILRNPQPQIKWEMELDDWFDRLPDAASEPRPKTSRHRSPESPQQDSWNRSPEPPSNDEAPFEQYGEDCQRESSPPAIPVQDAHLSQRPQLREPASSDWENNFRNARSSVRQNLDPTAEDWRLSQHQNDHLEHGHWVNLATPRRRRAPSAEPVSALSLSFQRFANMSARLYCVEDENFDVETVGWLVMGLGADECRRRLFYFYDGLTVDTWYCLGDVLSQPLHHLMELGSSQEACTSHGLSCKRVMVVKDELDFRRLRFESVHRDE